MLIGVATGLLWAPCAGPILGLVLTGAALQGASIDTTLLLLAYAAGAATSLVAGEWLRRGLGALMLAGGAILTIEFLDPNVSAYAFTFG